MALTILLAKVIGIYFILDGLLALLRYKELVLIIDELKSNKSAMIFISLIVSIFGLLVVVNHNIWSGSAVQVVVTIVGWTMIVKSLILALMPHEFAVSLIDKVNKPLFYRLGGVFMLVVGAWLAISGFTM